MPVEKPKQETEMKQSTKKKVKQNGKNCVSSQSKAKVKKADKSKQPKVATKALNLEKENRRRERPIDCRRTTNVVGAQVCL